MLAIVHTEELRVQIQYTTSDIQQCPLSPTRTVQSHVAPTLVQQSLTLHPELPLFGSWYKVLCRLLLTVSRLRIRPHAAVQSRVSYAVNSPF